MMTSSVFSRSIRFVRKNPSVFYSLFLIVTVVSVIFWNSYYSLAKFQKSTDSLIRGKALLSEQLFEVFADDLLRDPQRLSEKMTRIQGESPDVSNIVVFERSGEEGFRALVSTDSEDMGKLWNEPFFSLAWSQEEGVAFLSNDRGKRFWNVLRQVRNDAGQKTGLVLFQLSLEESDAFVSAEVRKAYLVAIVSLLVVLLILANHLRFFRYAIRATELEEVDRMKDDFISMASHELKSPITILRGYTDLIKDGISVDDSMKEKRDLLGYVGNMESTLGRLGTLVDDLLSVSRLEQNRLPITSVAIDLDGILRPIADDFSILAKEKGLDFKYPDTDMSTLRIVADPERVKQIIVNLFSNAVKYTKEGSVSVTVSEYKGDALITVADTGLGISAEDMSHLFEKFYRIKNVETEKIPGTGLGLWIAREIAQKMGGDLTVESISGVGSHFSLRLKKSHE